MIAEWGLADNSMFWHLPGLVAAISLVYSGTRFESWHHIVVYAVRWAAYILTFLAATWLFIYLIGTGSYYYVPIALGMLLLFLFGGNRRQPAEPKASSPGP